MNPFQALQRVGQLISNPLGTMQQEMLRKMQQSNPQKFNEINKMLAGKTEQQQREMFQNLAKERGIDVNQFANQFGIKL